MEVWKVSECGKIRGIDDEMPFHPLLVERISIHVSFFSLGKYLNSLVENQKFSRVISGYEV